MKAALAMLRAEPRARWFFAAHAQSSLGTGAAYVGLIILAYERLDSAWAIALVLLADFLPAMFLGPIFGAAADRWSRRTCAIVADLLRAAAFVGLAMVDTFMATVAFALLAGAGTGLFMPAALAAIPSLMQKERVPAGTALYGALTDVGFTVGPALAALALLVAGPETVMLANGVTFALSALALARIDFGRVADWDSREQRRSLFADAVEGSRVALRLRGVRAVIVASAAVILFAGMFNVAELPLVTEELGGGDAAFSLMVAIFGLGIAAGSMSGARGGSVPELKRRYLLGILVTGVGLVGAGLAPSVVFAVLAFAGAGVGNGLVLVHERLLLQATVPDSLLGRVFGLKDAAISWGYGIAFVSAGGLLGAVGTRELVVAGGLLLVGVWIAASAALRGAWTERPEPEADALPPEARRRARTPVGAPS